jgi:cyclic-di-AMP phosphodiesterase PgpH
MSMLSGAMKKKSTVIYASIIILSTNMTIAFAFNNFIFDTKTNYNYFKSLFSIIAVLVTAYFVYALYNRFVFGEGEEEELIEKYSPDDVQNTSTGLLHASSLTASTVAKEVAATNSNQEVEADILSDTSEDLAYVSGTSYEVLCDLENTLLKQLKEYSVSIYEHSLSIGELSKRAAGEIGANEMLALAGGLYHEIGKLKGKNYIEEGLNLAEEYAFPKELKQIIKQHNIKYDKPGSVEAAIVMMSDSVVSTIDYIKNSDEKKFSTNKIIENIFQLRMEKGTFDACSLSLKDYKKLKEFFQNEFGDELKKS